MYMVLGIPQGTRPLIHLNKAKSVSGAILGVLVGGTNRDVSFSLMFAGEGGLLGPPERLSGTSSS